MSHLKFGEFVRLKRSEKGVRGTHVAKTADITRGSLYHVESGKHVPGLDVAMAILKSLGESLESFSAFLKEEKKEEPVTQVEMVERKFLNYSTELPCLVCGRETENGNTFHHVISQKNLGPDEDWNLMPLCLEHHNEIHSTGRTTFAEKYVSVHDWMVDQGWDFSTLTGKWSH